MSFHSAGLIRCEDCGGLCDAAVRHGQHGTRWVVREGRQVLLNCVNREVKHDG
jgi:hypothetical protein